MKKRLISLFMCIIMLLSAFMFSACSDDLGDGDEETEDEIPVITIYGIKEPGTTDEGILAVEKALSDIAFRKHKVKIDLLLFEEKEYASIVFNKAQTAMNAYNSELKKTNGYDELINTDVDYTIYNEDKKEDNDIKISSSIPQELANARMDIFLVYNPKADSEVLNEESEYYSPGLANGGMFNILYEQKALLGLDTYLKDGNYAALRNNAYSEALSAVNRVTYATLLKEEANQKKDTFGIPNNIVYGGYEFMVFDGAYVDQLWPKDMNKDILVKLDGTMDSQALQGFIKELNKAKIDGKIPADVEIKKVFETYEEFNTYVREGGKFCIATVKGDLSVKTLCSQSGEFEVYERSVQSIEETALYESMFCISPSAKDRVGKGMSDARVKNAIDVLILLNTDTEFRNIFQYGIRDTHYTMGRDGIVYVGGTKKNSYIMDPLYCGNMFIIHPSDRMSTEMQKLAENKWRLGKEQVDAVLKKYKGQ